MGSLANDENIAHTKKVAEATQPDTKAEELITAEEVEFNQPTVE